MIEINVFALHNNVFFIVNITLDDRLLTVFSLPSASFDEFPVSEKKRRCCARRETELCRSNKVDDFFFGWPLFERCSVEVKKYTRGFANQPLGFP